MQHRDKLSFNKCVECNSIHASRIDIAGDIIIQSHGRENAEIDMILELNRIWNNATFWSPIVCMSSYIRIDTRFIEENNLFDVSLCNLSNPDISKCLISLYHLFCKLILANNLEMKLMNLFMRDPKSLKNAIKLSYTDHNIVSIVDFF